MKIPKYVFLTSYAYSNIKPELKCLKFAIQNEELL